MGVKSLRRQQEREAHSSRHFAAHASPYAEKGVHPARAADHYEIHALLRDVFQGPSLREFQAQLAAPNYLPEQRLVIREQAQLAAHVRYLPMPMQLGPVTLPIAWLTDLATAVPFRRRGFASRLVAAAEEAAQAQGAVLGLVRTVVPHFFNERGWFLCGRHCLSRVQTERLLAAVTTENPRAVHEEWKQPPTTPRVVIRPFRRLDLEQLLRLEELRCRDRWGLFPRSPAQWEWLLERKAFSEFLVAEHAGRLTGYAISCGARVVEIFAAENRTCRALLAQHARNGLEAGCGTIRIDAPPTDRSHSFSLAAGGELLQPVELAGESYAMKVLQPRLLLELTRPVWQPNVQALGAKPSLLEWMDEEGRSCSYRLAAEGSASEVESGTSRASSQLTLPQFGRLLLGQQPEEGSVTEQSCVAHARSQGELVAACFPRRDFYFPILEQLLS